MSNKLIEEARGSKTTIGHAGLGLRGDKVMSPAAAAHDGDTVFARALANISIRFLGVDTPEVAFTLPGDDNPTPIGNPKWESFLSDPFADWPDAKQDLGTDTYTHFWLTTPDRVPLPTTTSMPRRRRTSWKKSSPRM